MLDAVGKPSAGIFEGALTMFGNYRQCLSIRAPDDDDIETGDQFEEYFRGQYCIIHLKPWLPAKKQFYGFNSTIEQLIRKDYPIYEKTVSIPHHSPALLTGHMSTNVIILIIAYT